MTQALTVSNGVSASSRGGGERVFLQKKRTARTTKEVVECTFIHLLKYCIYSKKATVFRPKYFHIMLMYLAVRAAHGRLGRAVK